MIDHHAVLLVGKNLSETGYFTSNEKNTTELERLRFEILAIDDVRKIITSAYSKPFEQQTKTIVIEAASIASEAQQALLKVLEEPPLSTKFIIVLASKSGLLPTLLSRVAQPQVNHLQPKKPHNELFTMFLKSSYAARLEVITKITKDKDTQKIEFLRAGIEGLLAEKTISKDIAVLSNCLQALTMRGASKKMLLEEIALTIPLR